MSTFRLNGMAKQALPLFILFGTNAVDLCTDAAFAVAASDYSEELAEARKDTRYSKIMNDAEKVRIFHMHKTSLIYRKCDNKKKFDGTWSGCSASQIAALMGAGNHEYDTSSGSVPDVEHVTQTNTFAQVSAPDVEAGGDTKDQPQKLVPYAITPFLRSDMPDISLFSTLPPPGKDNSPTGTSASKAAGAKFSFSSDRIMDNDSWSLDGVAGVAYQIFDTTPISQTDPFVLGMAFAPYVSTNWLFDTNSKLKSKEVETTTAGAKFEVGIDNILGGAQYFRVGGAGNFNGIGDSESTTATLEWIPVYADLIHSPRAAFGD